jgi:hypothetical protein
MSQIEEKVLAEVTKSTPAPTTLLATMEAQKVPAVAAREAVSRLLSAGKIELTADRRLAAVKKSD